MDEDGIRKDIATFDEMGFGAVEVVSMVYTTTPAAEYAWGSENWNKAMDVILDECAKRDMTADFTIGPSWPIASPYVTDADNEGSVYELL